MITLAVVYIIHVRANEETTTDRHDTLTVDIPFNQKNTLLGIPLYMLKFSDPLEQGNKICYHIAAETKRQEFKP